MGKKKKNESYLPFPRPLFAGISSENEKKKKKKKKKKKNMKKGEKTMYKHFKICTQKHFKMYA